MDSITNKLRELKKRIYIQVIIINTIGTRSQDQESVGMYNITNSLRLSRSWIGKALSYIPIRSRQYRALREEVADRADPKEPIEGDIDEILAELEHEIETLTAELSKVYAAPEIAQMPDNALMCLEYAWQHLNEADFHLAYILDYRNISHNGTAGPPAAEAISAGDQP